MRDLSVLRGIWRRMPHLSCAVLLAVLSLVGIPGLIGFTGLYPVLGALFAFEWLGALLAMIAGLIVAWSLFWTLERVVFSPQAAEIGVSEGSVLLEHPHDLRPIELWLIALLGAGILFVGIRPQAVVDLIEASIRIASFTP